MEESHLHDLPFEYGVKSLFAVTMLDRLDSDPGFLKRVCFSDESTFHVSGLTNRHNSRIWGLQNPHETYELERDSPKLNVWCGIMHDKILVRFSLLRNQLQLKFTSTF